MPTFGKHVDNMIKNLNLSNYPSSEYVIVVIWAQVVYLIYAPVTPSTAYLRNNGVHIK